MDALTYNFKRLFFQWLYVVGQLYSSICVENIVFEFLVVFFIDVGEVPADGSRRIKRDPDTLV